jgi:predicted ATPase
VDGSASVGRVPPPLSTERSFARRYGWHSWLCASVDWRAGCRRPAEQWFSAELNRHKGRLLARQGQSETAEELYCKALSIAEKQEAKMWELRAVVSLAEFRRGQGSRAEARDLLALVYDWFAEGFGTPDLKQAKALLDELA